MSVFNESNELASELVYGRYYQSNEPCSKPERLVFVKGGSTAIVTATDSVHDEWAGTASCIERLLREGYRLGCDMDVSWNGRYDTDGDPEPGANYLPCRKPVTVNLDGRHLCDKHDYAEYKATVQAALQGRTNVEKL
jgi:hypothetical protein